MTTVNNSPDKNSTTQTLQAPPVCTEDDIYYFREGTNNRLYRWMGAHPCTHATQEGGKPEKGCWFAVWAPNAREVEVIGDFTPRGGISILPFANYGRPGTKYEELAFQRLANHPAR